MNFNFGEVLSRAWQIIWKHKILWIFGVFAGCARGGGSGGGGGGGGNGPGSQQSFDQIGQWIADHPWIIVAIVLAILALVVISIFLGTLGRIGLIVGTRRAERGEEHLVFGELFSESMSYFWRVFGLSLLIGLITLVVFIPFVLLGIVTAGICLIPFLCIMVPVLWGVAVVIEQANAAIVLDDLGIGDGLRKGWDVARANLGPMIGMGLILFIGSSVVGIVIAIPVIIAVLPAVFAAASQTTAPIWIAVACCALYFPVLLVLNGIVTAYMQTAWALTYLRLTRPQTSSPTLIEANA